MSTALAATALAALALAGCGSGSGARAGASPTLSPQAAATESSASPDADITAIVACYRAHGDPGFPDPVYDPRDGRWHFGTSPGSAPITTQQACQHLFPQASASPPIPQAQFQKLVQLAECLRGHGVPNWPDPAPDGSFGLPASLLGKPPALRAATTACQRYEPSGGLNIHAAP
jgi:hypothetical protein